MDRAALDKALSQLFDAERTARELHEQIAAGPRDDVLASLEAALAAARDHEDEDEASLRLVRIAELLGEFEGARAVDALIDVLASELPEARAAAGESLEALAYDRFKEVAMGVERALERLPEGSPALPELPYLLAEIPEPGVVKLLGKFLQHQDADAVAAAIEALADIGDPAATKLLEPLADDKRTVQVADDAGGEVEVTLGELAEEALELLEGGEPEGEDKDD